MVELHSPEQAAQWLQTQVRGQLRTDSREVGQGDGFIAWPGAATDGRRYLGQALAQGAAACLMEREGAEQWLAQGPQALPAQRLGALPGLKALTGWVAHAYYQQPSERLRLLAVTGTNGKTSIACWLAQALAALAGAPRCGVIGTLGVGLWPQLHPTGLTTPDPVRLQHTLLDLLGQGATHCAMEASSIGLAEHRMAGLRIDTAIFSNFTQDHLDYHGDMGRYWAAKRALFDWPGLRAAVVNIDDPQGAGLAAQLQGRDLDLWTCARQAAGPARLRATRLDSTQGLRLLVQEGAQVQTLQTALLGDFNIDNLLAVIAALRAQGVTLADAVQACAALAPVPGRMQSVGPVRDGQVLALVDYAHTPDALAQALQALAPVAQARGGRIWCVFGCGGNRDAGKRPQMARVAEAAGAQLVLTSDNPRDESPADILAQMVAGLQRPAQAQVIDNRAQAIAHAVRQAQPQDVLLVAGKGHETTQEIAGVLHPFSDAQVLARCLQEAHA